MALVLLLDQDTQKSQLYSLNLHIYLGVDVVVKDNLQTALEFTGGHVEMAEQRNGNREKFGNRPLVHVLIIQPQKGARGIHQLF